MDVTIEFFEAVTRGDAAKVSALVGASPDLVRFARDHGKTALHWAAEHDRIEIARILVDAGADIEAKSSWGASPLDWAAFNGHVGTVELLISRGANLSLKDVRFGATAEGWAQEAGHSQIADILRRSRRTA